MTAVLLAAYLHVANVHLVQAVYDAGGLLYVALIACENPKWDPACVVHEPRRHTSAGLPMIDDEWWTQPKDAESQIRKGWWILHVRFGDDPAKYNGGDRPNKKAQKWGYVVERERDELARWLWNHEQIAGGKV